MYAAGSPDEVLRGLDRDGLSLMRIPELLHTVSRSEVDAAVKYGIGGRAIFQKDLRDKEGNRIDELNRDGQPTGFYESDYGTHQRIQRVFPKQGNNILLEFRGRCIAGFPTCHIMQPCVPAVPYLG